MIGESLQQPSLLGLWHLNGNGNDSSINGFTLTASNATYVTAKFNQGGNFVNDATHTQYFTTSGTPTAITRASGGALSVYVWVRIGINKTASVIVQKDANAVGGSYGNFYLSLDGLTFNFGYTNAANNQTYYISSTPTIALNKWYFLALTYTFPVASNATKPLMYINASPVALGSWSNTPDGTVINDNADQLFIGADSYKSANTSENRGYNGQIDEVVLFSKIVTPVEIKKYYQWSMGLMSNVL